MDDDDVYEKAKRERARQDRDRIMGIDPYRHETENTSAGNWLFWLGLIAVWVLILLALR